MALALGALLVAVLALGFAAADFLGVVAFLALEATVLVLGAALAFVALGLASLASSFLVAFSFYKLVSKRARQLGCLKRTLAAGFFSAGLASFLASLTGPEGP